MRYLCGVCGTRFHDVEQSKSEERDGLCPSCGHKDIREIESKVCPVLSMGQPTPRTCIHESCASWNDYFQMCNMALPGFLNAREEERAKQEETGKEVYAETCGPSY